MAILGRLDASTFANNVGVTNASATVTKNAADEIDQGDIIELGGVPYLVKQVNTTTQITLHTDYAGSTNAALAGAVRRTAPKAVAEYIIKGGDSVSYEILFVDATEEAVSTNKSRGIWGPGWWKYRTFVDASGNTRHKAECIAALQATALIAGDDDDDAIVADAETTITISAQPTNQSTVAPLGGLLTVDTVSAAVGTRPAGTYTISASDYTTDAAGTGATFTITVDGTGAATIDSIDAAGSGFVVDETFTILGSVFDNGTDPAGTDGVDDLTFDAATVAAATATFSVTAAAAPSGTVVYLWQRRSGTSGRWTNVSGTLDGGIYSDFTTASLVIANVTTAQNDYEYRVKLTSTAGAEEVISDAATLTVTAA